MIIRVWKCNVKQDKVDEFLAFTNRYMIPILKAQSGCLGHYVGKLELSKHPRFVIISLWKDFEAIREFTGPNWQTARIDPVEAPLLDGQPMVEHYTSTVA